MASEPPDPDLALARPQAKDLLASPPPPPPAHGQASAVVCLEDKAAKPSKKISPHNRLKESQMQTALRMVSDKQEVSQLPIAWITEISVLGTNQSGEEITTTHWVKRVYRADANAKDWRKDSSFKVTDSCTKHSSPPVPANLFSTGCAKTLQAPGEPINSCPLGEYDAHEHLLKQLAVRDARATLNFCIGVKIEEPDDAVLEMINQNIIRDFGADALQLTKEQVVTWVFHEKMITTAFAAAIKTKMTTYQRICKDLIDMIKYRDTRFEQAFPPNSPVGVALQLLRSIVLRIDRSEFVPTSAEVKILDVILDDKLIRSQSPVLASPGAGKEPVLLKGVEALMANINIGILCRIKDIVKKKPEMPRHAPLGQVIGGKKAVAKRKREEEQEERKREEGEEQLSRRMHAGVMHVFSHLPLSVLKTLHGKQEDRSRLTGTPSKKVVLNKLCEYAVEYATQQSTSNSE